MREVARPAALLKDKDRVCAATVGDSVISKEGLRSRDGGTPSTYRLVLWLIIVLAFVNVTSTVLMLASWADNRFLTNAATEPLPHYPSAERRD